jgi:hypothetical protein
VPARTLQEKENRVLAEFVAQFGDFQVPHGGTVQTSSHRLKSFLTRRRQRSAWKYVTEVTVLENHSVTNG